MTAVEHISHTPSSSSRATAAAAAAALVARAQSNIFLNPHIAAVGLFVFCFFQFPLILFFHFKTIFFKFGFSEAVSKAIQFGQSEQRLEENPILIGSSANTYYGRHNN